MKVKKKENILKNKCSIKKYINIYICFFLIFYQVLRARGQLSVVELN